MPIDNPHVINGLRLALKISYEDTDAWRQFAGPINAEITARKGTPYTGPTEPAAMPDEMRPKSGQ